MGAQRRLPWICVDDLGAIATLAFADPDRFMGAGLKLAADICSIAECREMWTEVMGRAPRRFPHAGMAVQALRRHRSDQNVALAAYRTSRCGPLGNSRDLARSINSTKVDDLAPNTGEATGALITFSAHGCPSTFSFLDASLLGTLPIFKQFE